MVENSKKISEDTRRISIADTVNLGKEFIWLDINPMLRIEVFYG